MKHRLKSTVAIVLMIMFGIFLPSFFAVRRFGGFCERIRIRYADRSKVYG